LVPRKTNRKKCLHQGKASSHRAGARGGRALRDVSPTLAGQKNDGHDLREKGKRKNKKGQFTGFKPKTAHEWKKVHCREVKLVSTGTEKAQEEKAKGSLNQEMLGLKGKEVTCRVSRRGGG